MLVGGIVTVFVILFTFAIFIYLLNQTRQKVSVHGRVKRKWFNNNGYFLEILRPDGKLLLVKVDQKAFLIIQLYVDYFDPADPRFSGCEFEFIDYL